MKSVMTHKFSMVPKANIPRSQFDRSHGCKTTFDAGYLIPVYVDEVLPGDTFTMNMAHFSRLATPLHPFMDNLFLDSFFFFVPYRLIHSNFKKMMGEQANPTDSISYLTPTMNAPAGTGHLVGSLSDYFGIPTGVASLNHISYFHRAYNLIWNEYFRDENLQDSVTVDLGDGPDTSTNYALLRRGKRHDYFTSCLPWPQKGTAVSIPLGTTAPVTGIAFSGSTTIGTNATSLRETASTGVTYPFYAAGTQPVFKADSSNATTSKPVVYADLSSATAATINALRLAFQTQSFYERLARGGSRYTEIIRSCFGVTSPDARLQRPEYLGGGSSPVNVTPVPQQSATGATGTTTAQGNLAAMGTSSGSGHGFTKSFTEHGLIIGMVSARADLTYQQGLNRMFSRSTRLDYYWPDLAQIGEQAVLNKEIYCDGSANDALTFGYQERHAEYRYKPSIITGVFRSTYATTIDTWHLSQKFTSLPTLNATFIQDDPPIDRVIATPTEPHFISDFYFSLKCARPMPLYGVPASMMRL